MTNTANLGVAVYTHRGVLGELLSAALRDEPGIGRVYDCRSGTEVERLARQGKIDAVLVEPDNGDEDVFETVSTLLKSRAKPHVILMASSAPVGWVARGLELGISGYVGGGSSFADHARAIRAARSGERFFSPCAGEIIAAMAVRPPRVPSFTAREADILRRISEGETTKEIARGLGLEPKTIEGIRARLMEKTATTSSTALVRYACRHRLVRL